MKVDGYDSITSTSKTTRRRNSPAAGGFSAFLSAAEAGDAGAAQNASDIAAPAALSGLLALQEVPDALIQRKKLVQQGNNLLDALEKLRRQLLDGTLTLPVLQGIEQHIGRQRQIVHDPALNALMDDIELLAAVELAKIERAMRPNLA